MTTRSSATLSALALAAAFMSPHVFAQGKTGLPEALNVNVTNTPLPVILSNGEQLIVRSAPQPYFGTGTSGFQQLLAVATMNNEVPDGKRLIVEHVSFHVVQAANAPGARCRVFGQGPGGSLSQHDLVPQIVWATADFQRRSASTPMKIYFEPGALGVQCENLITGFVVDVSASVSGQLVDQ